MDFIEEEFQSFEQVFYLKLNLFLWIYKLFQCQFIYFFQYKNVMSLFLLQDFTFKNLNLGFLMTNKSFVEIFQSKQQLLLIYWIVLKLTKMSIKKLPKESVISSNYKNQSPEQPKLNELQQLVLANQNFSQQFRGYYTIDEWRKLNAILFSPNEYQQKTTITNCWRLMKLINFGDDIIPTGLIYDCIMTLMNVDQTVQQTQSLIKSIFLKFIEINGKHLTKKQRQQLAFFKVVRIVVEGYRKIIAQKLDTDQQSTNAAKQKANDRNQQLYLLHGVMTYKKDLQKLKKIEAEFKSCTFEPKINEKSQQIAESRYRNNSSGKKQQIQSPYKQVQSQCVPIDQSQEFVQSSRASQSFKAKPLPQYPEYEPTKEYLEHIERMQKSRQIRSINSISRRYQASSSKDIKQFTIQQRDQKRKRNLIENIRILFMIKVEVGKRIYRVKVRENMTVNDTVKAIQKMVGFQNSQLVDVVKGYFMNWQRREKQKLEKMKNSQRNSSDGF